MPLSLSRLRCAGHEHLLDLFEEQLDEPEGLLQRLDPSLGPAEWEALGAVVRTLHGVIHRCLEPRRKRRATIEELVPVFEEARGTAASGDESAAQEECVICLERPKSHVIIPCGHRCCCEICSAMLLSQRKRCPMCQGPCESILRVWD